MLHAGLATTACSSGAGGLRRRYLVIPLLQRDLGSLAPRRRLQPGHPCLDATLVQQQAHVFLSQPAVPWPADDPTDTHVNASDLSAADTAVWLSLCNSWDSAFSRREWRRSASVLCAEAFDVANIAAEGKLQPAGRAATSPRLTAFECAEDRAAYSAEKIYRLFCFV